MFALKNSLWRDIFITLFYKNISLCEFDNRKKNLKAFNNDEVNTTVNTKLLMKHQNKI